MLALNDILSRGGAGRCRVSRQSDGCRQAGSQQNKTGSSFEVHDKRLQILDLSPETFVNAFPFPRHYVAHCKSNLLSSIQLNLEVGEALGSCSDCTRRRWSAIHASASALVANGLTLAGCLSGILTSTANAPSSIGITRYSPRRRGGSFVPLARPTAVLIPRVTGPKSQRSFTWHPKYSRRHGYALG